MDFQAPSIHQAATPTQEWDVLEDTPVAPAITSPHAVEFPVALRGYDRAAVDAYLDELTRVIEHLEASRSEEVAVRRALDQVGEETSGILKRARETEWEITSKSRAKADDRLQTAERDARQMRLAAESEVRRLDDDTEKLWEERQRLLGDIGRLSGQLTRVADAANRRFPPMDGGEVQKHAAAAEGVTPAGGSVEIPDVEPAPVAHDPASIDEQPSAAEGPEAPAADGPEAPAVDPPEWAADEPLRVEEGRMEEELAWAEQELVGDDPLEEGTRNDDAGGPFGEPPVWEGPPIAIRRFSNSPDRMPPRSGPGPVKGPRPLNRPPLFERLRSMRPVDRP